MAKSKEELVELLRQNIKAFNAYRKETNNEFLDLSGTDLSVANLCRANLSNTNLTDCDLSYSYLHSANLKNANMTNLSFGRADMTEADLSGSILEGADLTNTILYGANLTNIKAKNIVLEGAKAREANFSNADLQNANLCNLDLNGVNFEGANIKSAFLSGSNLANAVNIHKAKFDNSTQWPDRLNLPAGFDPANPLAFAQAQDAEQSSFLNVDYGPGVAPGQQEYEFLDMPAPPVEPEAESPISGQTVELDASSAFKSSYEEPAAVSPPDFQQFTPAQFEDFPQQPQQEFDDFGSQIDQFEPGLAIPPDEPGFAVPGQEPGFAMPGQEPGLALPGQEPGFFDIAQDFGELSSDGFLSDFSSTMSDFSTSPPGPMSSISAQEFTVRPDTIASNMAPSPDLLQAQMAPPPPTYTAPPAAYPPPQAPPQAYPPPVKQPAPAPPPPPGYKPQIQPVAHSPAHAQQAPPAAVSPPTYQSASAEPIQAELSQQQIEPILDILGDISSKLQSIEDEQKSQRQTIDLLKQSIDTKQQKEMFIKKIDDVTHLSRSHFARLESKIDILAQTDPLDQLDTIMGEFSDNLQGEQENIDSKLNDLTTITESIVALLESSALNSSDAELISLSNNIKNMLTHLESNVRMDQQRAEQKIEEMAGLLNNFAFILDTVQKDVRKKLPVQRLDILTTELHSANQRIIEITDLTTNINNTIGTLIELKQDNTAELQVFEAFYDFEFRIQLEMEKHQNRLATLEEMAKSTLERLDVISKLDTMEGVNNISTVLERLRDKLLSEMKQIEEKSGNVRELTENLAIQLRAGLSSELAGIRGSLETDLSVIRQKIDTISTQHADEIMQAIESLIERNINTEKHYERATAFLQNEMEKQVGQLQRRLGNLDNKIEKVLSGSKLDEETKATFDKILDQVTDINRQSKENTNKLGKKMEDQDFELQMSIKELDRRVSKINSMVRNIYKALDSLTDLVTDTPHSKPARASSHLHERSRRDLIPRSKDYDDDMDFDDT